MEWRKILKIETDIEEQADFLRRHQPIIHRAIVQRCGQADEEKRKAITQDAWRKMTGFFQKPEVEQEGNLHALLRKIAENSALDESIKMGRSMISYQENPEDSPKVLSQQLNSFNVGQLEAADELYVACKCLNVRELKFLRLREFGMSHKEIATIMGVSEETARNQLAKIRKKLRNQIEKRRNK